tara:strand:+ start:2131 stop:2769 length:639 start_codon:yes stop_codon:yes gene_type:complete
MRGGVLSDSYIEEFCKEFRPVPLKDIKILKIEHPLNPYSGIKPIYNQSVAVPATINTMVANIHRANHKAGDLTSDHEELLEGVLEEVKSEAVFVKGEVVGERAVESYIEERVSRFVYETPERSRPARGGAREGSGRMTGGESALKEQIEGGLAFKEKIKKKDIQEAIRYSGGDFNEAISRVITDKKEEAVGNVLEAIMRRVEKQIETKEKSK